MRTGIAWFGNRRAVALCMLLVMMPLLSACTVSDTGSDKGGDARKGDEGWVSWNPTPPSHATDAAVVISSPVASGSPAGNEGAVTPTIGGKRPVLDLSRTLTSGERKKAQPDELGAVPILMYHALTSEPALVADFTRLSDDFRNDLQWLYDHDFHVITMRSLLDNTIAVPAGKHPVVLTFDDASPGQFLFVQSQNGNLVPGPTSAVGIMEAFFAEHPDFGHTAHFAFVTNYCFGLNIEFNTPGYCQQKLDFLAVHGYEIGNHTTWHDNLSALTADGVAEEVGGAAMFIDEHVKGDANMSRTLTLPYGARPDPGTHPEAAAMLTDGFTYKGKNFRINAEIEVSGGPAFSPSSADWDPFAITLFNTDDASLDQWFSAFENGDVVLYTSDGNPDTVTVPDPIPTSLADQLDPALIAAKGFTFIQYDPATGGISKPKAASARWTLPAILGQPLWVSDRVRAAG